MSANSLGAATRPSNTSVDRHPPALRTLFLTEMWERFSYYGMRALLVLYLVNALGVRREDALELYGIYTALVYVTPVIGGYLADRYLGHRKAIFIGGLTMALGHFAMAFEPLLYLALGLLIIGNGFFKPNISTLVGSLYAQDDPKRDAGFTWFYVGLNLGAFLSPLVAGTLGEKVGWHWGFASAGVGMLFGLAQFAAGQRKLGGVGLRPGQERLRARDVAHIVLISLAMIPLTMLALWVWRAVGPVWHGLSGVARLAIVVGAIAVLWIAGRAKLSTRKVAAPTSASSSTAAVEHSTASNRTPLTREEWERVIAIVIVGFFVVFFWMGFEQAGGTMNLFADKRTDRMVFGWELPASYFQAINPLAIIALGPVMSWLWTRLSRSRYSPSTPTKMALGIVILGLGFVVLALGDAHADAVGRVSPAWLIVVYLLHTVGELCLSPIGLSMVSKVAPARLVAMSMGVWFTANAVANYFAGVLEAWLTRAHIPLYWFLVASSLGAGAVMLVLSKSIGRLMHERA